MIRVFDYSVFQVASKLCVMEVKHILGSTYTRSQIGMDTCYMHDLFARNLEDAKNCMTIELHTVTSAKVDSNDICPISWMSYDEIEKDMNEKKTKFIPHKKDVVLARLPCRHVFSVYHLVKQFCVNDMRCSVCRQGLQSTLAIQSLPRHLRGEMTEFYKAILIQKGPFSPRDVTNVSFIDRRE